MDRDNVIQSASRPHARGGEPSSYSLLPYAGVGRPHARGGEPGYPGFNQVEHPAVPTPVGVNRCKLIERKRRASRPHARGGEPKPLGVFTASAMAVPTPVGVNRKRMTAPAVVVCRPHARGGEPIETPSGQR